MTNLTISILTKPAVQVGSASSGVAAAIGTWLGIINPIIGTIVLGVGLATAIIGLMIKIKQYRKQ